MKQTHTVLVIGVALVLMAAFSVSAGQSDVVASIGKQIDQSDLASAEVKSFAKDKLLPLCSNEIFIKAVAAQNAKGISLDDIKKLDEEWRAAEDVLPIHSEVMENECATEIQEIVKANPKITELFVMDNQGANVAQNALTSDYWQGDEAKWQNSYNDGKGGVDIGKPKLDKSTNRVDQKVSLPIVDASGKVIGAVCVGIAH